MKHTSLTIVLFQTRLKLVGNGRGVVNTPKSGRFVREFGFSEELFRRLVYLKTTHAPLEYHRKGSSLLLNYLVDVLRHFSI